MEKLLTSIFFLLIVISSNIYAQSSRYDLFIKNALDYYSKGQSQQAMVELEKAHTLDSTRVESYYYTGIVIAEICYRTGKSCDGAITMLTTSININPNFRNGYYNRGVCFLKIGYLEQALKDFNQAILNNQADGDYYANRGITLYYLGQKKEACLEFNKAIHLNSSLGLELKNQYCN